MPALIAVVTGLSVVYGKAFGPYQTRVAQWVIDALGIASRFRGQVNMGTDVAIVTAFTVIAVVQLDQPGIIAVGVLAGVFASVETERVHVQSKVVT